MEEISLRVVDTALIHAQQSDQSILLLEVLVLVRQVATSMKEITRYRDVRSEFDTALRKLQLIDFAGLTSPLGAMETEVHTNRIASQRTPMRRD